MPRLYMVWWSGRKMPLDLIICVAIIERRRSYIHESVPLAVRGPRVRCDARRALRDLAVGGAGADAGAGASDDGYHELHSDSAHERLGGADGRRRGGRRLLE